MAHLPETPLITLDEAELARQQVQAAEAGRAAEYASGKNAYDNIEVGSLEEHEQLGQRLRDLESGTFEDYLGQIQNAEDEITGASRVHRFIGRLLLRPRHEITRHQINRTKAYNEYMQGITGRQIEARRRARLEKSLNPINDSLREHSPSGEGDDDRDYAIERDRLLSELRERFDKPEKPAGKLRRTAEKVRQNPKIRRIGKFVVSDIPNTLGPSLPERHEFLSNHFQHYQETLKQEEDAHAQGTLTAAEKLAAEAREQAAIQVFNQDIPSIDKLYSMVVREPNQTKLLEIYRALDWLADDLRQVGIEGIRTQPGDKVNPALHNIVQSMGGRGQPVISSIERLGFQMENGTIVRKAGVIMNRAETGGITEQGETEQNAEIIDIRNPRKRGGRSNKNEEQNQKQKGDQPVTTETTPQAEQEHDNSESEPRRAHQRGARGKGSLQRKSERRAQARQHQPSEQLPTPPPEEPPQIPPEHTADTDKVDKFIQAINQQYLIELDQIKDTLSERERLNIQQSILRRLVPGFFGVKSVDELKNIPDEKWNKFADEIQLSEEEQAELRG